MRRSRGTSGEVASAPGEDSAGGSVLPWMAPELDLPSPLMATRSHVGDRAGRFALLLGAVITAFGVEGVSSPAQWEQVVVSALLGITLLLALWAAATRPRYMRIAALISAGLVLVSVIEVLSGSVDGSATRLANALLVGLAPPAIVIGFLQSLRTRQSVTVEAVLGVLCVYILLGMFFAFIYGMVARLGGSPFFAGGQDASFPHCLYFSFTTLTTVGYGDFTARTNLGHTLAVSEALFGQIYLVTVVSLIVGNLGRGRPVAPEPPAAAGSS